MRLLTPLHPLRYPAGDTFDYSQIPDVLEGPNEKFMALVGMLIAPGATGYLRFQITLPTEAPFEMTAWANDPFLTPGAMAGPGPLQSAPLSPEEKCWNAFMSQFANELLNILINQVLPTKCLNESFKATHTVIQESFNAIQAGNEGQFTEAAAVSSFTKILTAGLKAGATCAVEAAGVAVPELKIALALYEITSRAIDLWRLYDNCKDLLKPKDPVKKPVQPVNSNDPNDKFGPVGAGGQRYISPAEPLRYAIQFENKPSATAPAQDVVITDVLDPAKVDFDTFALGPIAFGDRTVVPPPYTGNWTTDIDLRPENNLLVRITAGLDRANNSARWEFRSLNPETMQPPEDPLAGFLPPNTAPPAGEGQVLFTVSPKADLPTGTEIPNAARIVFDVNAPIDTPTWLNTLDRSLPESQVQPVNDLTFARFTLAWAGTDEGSGIGNFTVYASEDGGPFLPLERYAEAASRVFEGVPGRTYAFYSVAKDRTGNREADAQAAEVTVQIPLEAHRTGDVNLDRVVDVADAVRVLRYAVDLEAFDEVQWRVGDVNLDTTVNVADAVDILRKVVGLPTSF